MSDEERNAMEEEKFEVEELDEEKLEEVAGGTLGNIADNGAGCNESQCYC